MTAPKAQPFIAGLKLPEGPRWRDGALWFSDIHGHTVYRATEPGKPQAVARLDDRASGLGFLPDGTLLVVSLLDRKLMAVGRDGAVQLHANLSTLSRSFINDMVVDKEGRAYVGSRNGGDPASASDTLLLVMPDGSSRTVAEKMVSPNGSVVTPDGQYLIVAETAVGRLARFRIESDGSLSNRETVTQLDGRHIDGLCLDDAGAFWGGGGAGGLLRIGANGALLEVIEFPGRMVLACTLGGPRGTTLFLATTSTDLLGNLQRVGADRSLDAGVNSDGRIETMEVDIPGVGSP